MSGDSWCEAGKTLVENSAWEAPGVNGDEASELKHASLEAVESDIDVDWVEGIWE